MMIKRWPSHIPHLPHHKITIYGWSTSHSSSRTMTTEPGAILNLAESCKVDKLQPSLPLSAQMR